MQGKTIILLAAACASCGKPPAANESEGSPAAVLPEQAPRSVPSTLRPGPLVEDRALPEGPIDPTSAQGAGQVLQRFAALLEQRRFGEASGLGEEDFTGIFPRDSVTHSEIGSPGQIEGAAGSLYVRIPIRFYGTLSNGKPVSQRAIATLRRVNDVPGSTEEQRKWRIYRLDMQQPD